VPTFHKSPSSLVVLTSMARTRPWEPLIRGYRAPTYAGRGYRTGDSSSCCAALISPAPASDRMESTNGRRRRPFAWTDAGVERSWQGIAAAITTAGLACGVAEHLW